MSVSVHHKRQSLSIGSPYHLGYLDFQGVDLLLLLRKIIPVLLILHSNLLFVVEHGHNWTDILCKKA